MTATSKIDSSKLTGALYLAVEMGLSRWKLAFSIGGDCNPRIREITARDLEALKLEIAKAKKRFGLAENAAVFSCYEAGRDGFWLHRYLLTQDIHNTVVDASSIEVPRRKRRVKTDRVDAQKLVGMLVRYLSGEKKVWSVVQPPKPETEDLRHVHRDLETLKAERTEHVNRIKGLLICVGVKLDEVDKTFAEKVTAIRQWNGQALGLELDRRLHREYERWQLLERQIAVVEEHRAQLLQDSKDPNVETARRLQKLKSIGPNSGWLFSLEFFGWRGFQNGKQIGALAGLTPTPYDSGNSSHEQGISKAGNRRLRALAIEIAWLWLRYQPKSKLSLWYWSRFGHGKSRLRRIGIVALARKLLIALWHYLQTDQPPEGAVFKPTKKAKKARQAKTNAA